MLEFVLEPLNGNEPAAVAAHAARIAADAFNALDLAVQTRLFDTKESLNLETTTDDAGLVDMRDFIICQAIDRRSLTISAELRTVSAIYSPAIVREEGEVMPFGYAVKDLSEAAVSTHNIRVRLLANPTFNNYAAHFFAYTMAHEAGHLYGLVDPEAARHIVGMHCSNQCVMQATSLYETADYLQQTNGAIHFCEDCATDIIATNQSEHVER